jgi:hypothetical protein
MEKIHKLIGFTETQYTSLVFQMMLTWADLYSSGCPRKMQTLLANRQVNSWFQTEFRKLIQQFRAELKPFENEKNITCKERCKLFINTVTAINEIYPSALMTQHKAKAETPFKNQNFINN